MSRRAHQTGGLGSMLLPAGLLSWGWESAGQPFGDDGLWAVILAGALAAVVMPALLLSAPRLPMLLVPSDWRRKYRHRRPRDEQHSQYISKRLRLATLAADRHRCIYRDCGVRVGLEVDHIFPWSLGGLTALWNTATLCKYHNGIKSNYWRYRRSGNVIYNPFKGKASKEMAADILAYELAHRWNPLRWIRAGLALVI
jgi:hypothetical protein